MGKAIRKWAAIGLTAAVLGGCGSDGGEQDAAQRPGALLPSDEGAESAQGSGQENLEEADLGSDAAQEDPESAVASGGTAQEDPESGRQPGQGSQGNAGSGAAKGDNQGDASPGDRLSGADPDRQAMIEAYIAVLEDIYFDQTFPGGEEYGYQPGAGQDVTSNCFSVYDIDFDGQDELIVCYTSTYTAGMTELIYGYDSASQSVRKELGVFPSLTYYDNGIILEEASHNHGMASDGAGDFWPYYLHQYDAEQDCYVTLAGVDAWSKAYRQEDYDGNPFPDEVDADGDGLVYYVMPAAVYELKDPMDGAAYDQWRGSFLNGADQVKVPYMDLITENIYTLQ